MAITKARKEELLAQYDELIKNSRAIFLAEYSGMNVKQMNALRDKVYEANGAFHVTKNTLFRIALEKSDKTLPDDFLAGQLATGFALAEAPSLAKALVDYAKDDEKVTLRGGFFGNEFMTAEQVEALAKLPSLDELRSQIIGLIDGPARNVASIVASGVRQVVNVIDAYAKSEEAAAEAA
ncbi:MAG: 50S ribosomal protein L10 [Ardenticatenaceae bacterium]|nr:50S ribosomal protein L10 [Anaerolineales bacterium]MCB8940765.1 50S ribosomal protein L10 [Ardenticatenaceae bacterium]MCB8972104.1 50S ribosomal protein L10 [Ardenticatenaceae bacterium]